MKKELPIAICLLALGAVLCFNLDSSHGRRAGQGGAGQPITPPTDSPRASGEVPTMASGDSSSVADNHNAAGEGAPQSVPAAAYLHIDKGVGGEEDRWCRSTLASVGETIKGMNAFGVRTKIQCHTHDLMLSASGKYFQTDQGDKTRMELLFDDPKLPHSLLQICDGQFSYTLRSNTKEQRLEFVDLSRLENRGARLQTAGLPLSWSTGGGLGNSYVHYAEAFHFSMVEQNQANENQLRMRGLWDRKILNDLIHSAVPIANRPQKIIWDELPQQIPHAIDLTFFKRPDQTLLPHTITFLRFDQQEEGRAVAAPILTIRFETLTPMPNLPEALFTIESANFEAVEMTEVYNEKIRELKTYLPKVAMDPSGANSQLQ